MKIWQRLATYSLWLVATALAYIVPLVLLFNKLVIKHLDVPKAKYSFGVAFVILVIMIIGIVVLKRWYKRKLQSIDVASELGVVGTTPLIIKRLLLIFQVLMPIVIIALLLYGITAIEIPSYKLFIEYIYWFSGGFVVYIIHDVVRNHFLNRNAIEKALKLEQEKDELRERTLTIKRKKHSHRVKRRNKK